MNNCNLCPRKCNVIRDNDKSFGFCGVPRAPKIAKATLHFGEEPIISGFGGSGTVFFSGCNLRCVFCQNYEVSHNNFGKTVSVERLAEIFYELEKLGAENINLVNPTHYVDAISEAFKIYKPSVPVVYNTSGYDSKKTILNDFTDIYLFDFKYFDNEKAFKYSSAHDYFEVALTALDNAYKRIGECEYDDRGMMKKGIVVRHLLLPQSTNDAIKIIDLLADKYENIVFSLMSQYVPMGDSIKFEEINRRISKREYDKVLDHLIDKNFSGIYVQEPESATTAYIPDFDLEGV